MGLPGGWDVPTGRERMRRYSHRTRRALAVGIISPKGTGRNLPRVRVILDPETGTATVEPVQEGRD